MAGNEKQLQDILASVNKLIEAASLNQQQMAVLQKQLDILSKKVSELEEQNRKLETQNELTNRQFCELYKTQSVEEVLNKMSNIGKGAVKADECEVYGLQDEEFQEALKKTEETTNFYAEGKKYVMSVPLETQNGDIIGVVVAKREKTPFTEKDAKIFDLNEGDLGTIFRVSLEEKMAKQAAITDKLTRLQNREGMTQFITNEVLRRAKDRLPVSAVMFDIDHFKRFNDTYGHDIGDRCLRLVANTIKNNIRLEESGVFRYGGEEMVMILPVNEEKAFEIAERVRHAVEETALIVNDKANETTQVTISGGVCEFNPKSVEVDKNRIENAFEKCIKQADNSLYQAKENGRNRVYGSDAFMLKHYSLPSPNAMFQSWYDNHSENFTLLNEKDAWLLVETNDTPKPYHITTPRNASSFLDAVIETDAFRDNVIEIMKDITTRGRYSELIISANNTQTYGINKDLAIVMLTEWENVSGEISQEIFDKHFADIEAIKAMVYTPDMIDRKCIDDPRQEQIKNNLKKFALDKNDNTLDRDV